MIKNILVDYGADRGYRVALRQALDIARPAQARLHLAQVVPLGGGAGETGLVSSVEADAYAVSAATGAQPEEFAGEEASVELEEAAQLCAEEGVAYTRGRYFGEASGRLLELSRLAELVVVARHEEGRGSGPGGLGRTARRLAQAASTPTLFCDREALSCTSAMLLYEPRSGGGRALSLAGEMCSLLNISLNVVCCGYGEVNAARAEEEARRALRAYHVEGQFTAASGPPAEALQTAALDWGNPLVVVPGPARRGWLADTTTVQAAFGLPNTLVLLVP
jgi:nucleotide-binding universal stress UspA family protein